MVESYLSAIDGGISDSETRVDKTSSQKAGNASVDAKIVSVGGQGTKENSSEIKRDTKITPASKFDKIFTYLSENNQAKYFEFIRSDTFESISRDDFIEVLVRPRFSKIQEMAKAAKNFSDMANVLSAFTDEPLIEESDRKSIKGIAKLGELKPSNTISCVLEFDEKTYPIVVDLDEQYFKTSKENFVGQVYVLCKIQRKLQKGEKIELDEIFEQFKNIPMNREQRRQMPKKDLKNPKEFRDIINGPAFTASVVAVYQ